jgi:hypothetical protein
MYGTGGFELNDEGFRHAAVPPLLQSCELHVLNEPLNTGCVVA